MADDADGVCACPPPRTWDTSTGCSRCGRPMPDEAF